MEKKKLEIYDPPMCCSSGVCGANMDYELARFSNDLKHIAAHGVEVVRYNLSSEPMAFAGQESVRQALQAEGNSCLPIVMVDGRIVSRGTYPARDKLMEFAGIAAGDAMGTEDSGPACGPGCCCG